MEIRVDPKFEKELQQIENTLAVMPKVFQDLLQGEMCFAGAGVITRHAKGSNKFKDRSGALRKSFRTVRIDTKDSSGRRIPDGGARGIMGGRKAPHGHLVELGTVSRVQSTTGRATGSVTPRLMMSHSFETQQTEALTAGVRSVRRNFKKFVKVTRNEGKLTRRQAKIVGA